MASSCFKNKVFYHDPVHSSPLFALTETRFFERAMFPDVMAILWWLSFKPPSLYISRAYNKTWFSVFMMFLILDSWSLILWSHWSIESDWCLILSSSDCMLDCHHLVLTSLPLIESSFLTIWCRWLKFFYFVSALFILIHWKYTLLSRKC